MGCIVRFCLSWWGWTPARVCGTSKAFGKGVLRAWSLGAVDGRDSLAAWRDLRGINKMQALDAFRQAKAHPFSLALGARCSLTRLIYPKPNHYASHNRLTLPPATTTTPKMHLPTVALALFAATAASEPLAVAQRPALHARQDSCGLAMSECGDGCIPIGYTCCPGGEGGCGLAETCVLGSNDEYGCCPIGRRCIGEGGVSTRGGGGGGFPEPTPTFGGGFDDDDDDFPTPTGGSSIGDDDDDDDDDLSFTDSSSSSSSSTSDAPLFTPETTANDLPTASAFSPPRGGDDDDDNEPSSAARGALSLVGVLAAAFLAL